MKSSALAIASLALALVAGSVAHAETVDSLCLGQNKSSMIEVTGEFAGTYSDLDIDQPVKGEIRIHRINGKDSTDLLPYTGTVTLSSKGPYFDLQAGDDASLLIAAPASGAPSVLTLKGEKIELMCD